MNGGFHMTDVAVVIVVLISGFLAFLRGFVRETLAILAWVGAAFIAMQVQPMTMGIAMDLIGIEVIAKYGAWVVIFLIALIFLSILSGALSNFVKDTNLNPLDRALGFVFGLARGMLLISILYFLGSQLMNRNALPPEWLSRARTYPLILRGADFVALFIPSDRSEQLARELEQKRRQGEALLEIQRNLQNLTAPPSAMPQPTPPSAISGPSVKPEALSPTPEKSPLPQDQKPVSSQAPQNTTGYDAQQRSAIDTLFKNKQ